MFRLHITNIKALHWEFQCNYANFENIQANVFDPQHLRGARPQLVQSMFKIGRKAAELERTKLQSEIQKQKSELRQKKLEKRVKMARKAGGQSGLVKNPKKTKPKAEQEEDDDLLDDLVMEKDPDTTQPSYSTLEPGSFVMKGADRKMRLDKGHAKIAAATGKPDEGQVEETEQERLEREADELTSQLKKAERAEAQAREKEQKDKAKRYSQQITSGQFLKQPKAVMLMEPKKRKKSMKMGDIASVDEEDNPDDIPEGFHLQEESPHCINMKRADDSQAYLRQIVLDFERLIKGGATNISEEYGKVIQSMFWAVKANKQTILNGVDPVEVLASIPDARCKAWQLKLNGKMAIDPATLVEDTEIGPQMASDVMNLKPQEIFELVEEELVGKTKEQINVIKKCIGNICREQVLAHRHAAEAADNVANLTELVSLPILIKVISTTMRPTVAIKIPEVEIMARAQQKVDAIRQAKQKVGKLKPIDEVVFAQNVPKYNPEWEHSPKGRATSYLATLVCRYMHELQQKDKKVVLSVKALEMIYHTASSSIGKLISGIQYLGGYALEQVREKVEAEGKELPFKKKKKLPQRSSGLVKTSSSMSTNEKKFKKNDSMTSFEKIQEIRGKQNESFRPEAKTI